MKVAVIIPFYQKETGLLEKAMRSVFTQTLSTDLDVHVYVIDDELPVAAKAEVDALPEADQARITLLKQPNGGPGAARNLGLDQTAKDGTDFVAFLDFDDIWRPQHLSDAIETLEQGFDFYFCDHTRFNADTTYAESIGSLVDMRAAQTPGCQVIDPDGPILTFSTERVKSAMIEDYLSQTSTVVVRQSCLETLRFRTELRGAGEDHFFWIALLCNAPATAISWRTNVHCDEGVNLYHSAFGFGSVESTNRIGYLLLFRQKCLELPLDQHCRNIVVTSISRYRRAYSYMFVRAYLIGQRPDMLLFKTIWSQMPLFPLAMPFRFLAVLPRRKVEAKDW